MNMNLGAIDHPFCLLLESHWRPKKWLATFCWDPTKIAQLGSPKKFPRTPPLLARSWWKIPPRGGVLPETTPGHKGVVATEGRHEESQDLLHQSWAKTPERPWRMKPVGWWWTWWIIRYITGLYCIHIHIWLVVEPYPLQNDGVCQLGWWFPTEWKNKKCSKPPSRYT